MLKFQWTILLFGLFAHAQQLAIMTYNLRVDFGGDGENNWEFRRDFLADQLAFYAPDFIGTQEGKAHQLQYLDSLLVDYAFIGTSRNDSKTQGEFSAIFYNRKKFRPVSEQTFWLSETPQQRSKGWDAAFERICTYGLFEDLQTKNQFYVFNTHLDHIGEVARQNGAKLILEKINSVNIKSLPVIFTGDFNSDPQSAAYQIITNVMNDTKTSSSSKPFGPDGTFNGFKFNAPVTLRIDYIFVSRPNFTVLKYAVLSDSKNCRYPSDHLPVYTQIVLK